VLDTIVAQLTPGPWLLGERFSAADVLWGTALHWTTMFKLVPDEPPVRDYIARVRARPAMQRAEAKDEAILAKRA
jgi:glutathione S-transferase